MLAASITHTLPRKMLTTVLFVQATAEEGTAAGPSRARCEAAPEGRGPREDAGLPLFVMCPQPPPPPTAMTNSLSRRCRTPQEAIALWEELRQKDAGEERRHELVRQILALIKGHMANIAASPTASRIIQSCVKYGTAADRATILAEVQPQLVELAQNPYGHFLVSKLLARASRAEASGGVPPRLCVFPMVGCCSAVRPCRALQYPLPMM